MKRLLLSVLLMTAALFVPSFVSACTCICEKYGDGSPIAMKHYSAAVFAGEVLAVEAETSDFRLAVKFRVERYWKGIKTQEITVHMSFACCSMPDPKMGNKYLVYAVGKERETTCTRTRRLDAADEDLRALGSGKTFGQQNGAIGGSHSR